MNISQDYLNRDNVVKSEDQSASERPVNGAMGSSFYNNGVTVLLTEDVYDYPTTIRGRQVITRAHKAAYFDNNGNFVDTGHVSPNSVLMDLYPTTDSAVGAFKRVKGIDKYESSRDFAKANIEGLVCVQAVGTKVPACRPDWNDTERKYDYSKMTKRDYTVYEIIPMPAKVKEALEKGLK